MTSLRLPLGLTAVFLACAARASAACEPEPQANGDGLPAVKGPAVKLPEGFVRFARVPEGGVQPLVEASEGTLSVLYFKGDEDRGDLFLTRSKDEAKTFEPSLRVNAEAGTVLSQESGHSGSLGVGSDGRAHILWVAGGEQPRLCYARERAEGGLDPVQDLGSPAGLRRTTALAIDANGSVHVFYVASDSSPADGEAARLRVWMRVSADGSGFSDPTTIDNPRDGVSEGSALAARIDRRGTALVLYATAGRKGAPEMRMLSRVEGGPKFVSKLIEPATRKAEPRARPRLSPEWSPKAGSKSSFVFASWDTFGRVFWGGIDPEENVIGGGLPQAPKGDGLTRRSRASFLASGSEFLLAWLEQPKGEHEAPAVVAWQVWFAEGRLALDWGRAPETTESSFPAVFANAPRGFTILY